MTKDKDKWVTLHEQEDFDPNTGEYDEKGLYCRHFADTSAIIIAYTDDWLEDEVHLHLSQPDLAKLINKLKEFQVCL